MPQKKLKMRELKEKKKVQKPPKNLLKNKNLKIRNKIKETLFCSKKNFKKLARK